MHFVRAGRGTPALLFVHGFGCTHDDWRGQLAHFSKRHEVVACDLRGHGQTPGVPDECSIEHYGGDVAALILNLEFSDCVLVGHSMGTRVVLEAARLVPKRISGLILVDGSRNAPAGDPEAAEATAKAMIDKVGYPAFADKLFRQMFFKSSPDTEAMIARGVRSSAPWGPVLYPRMTRWDAEALDPALAAVQAPMLVIQSTTRDANWNRATLKPGSTTPYLEMIRNAVPGAKIEIVPDTGHFTMLEATQTVNRLIEEFLAARR